MAKKSRRRTSDRLDLAALESAHKAFITLAAAQPRGEVRNALNRAALITSSLLIVTSAAFDLQLFFDTATGRRS
jgi:hypothetical protein